MDRETIFVKTSKGEDEIRSKTAYLNGDIKRALLMVDGNSTLKEISKRAAPSLRSILEEMFKELEKGGFIQDTANVGNIPKIAVPPKIATQLKKPVDDSFGELDFTAVFRAPSPEVLAAEAAKAEANIKARVLAEAKAKQESDAARIKAETKAKQEMEAARIKAQQEAGAARLKVEQEAAKAREEAKLARQQAEAEARGHQEAERRAREEAEAARVKAEREVAQARAELEAARAKAEAEAEAKERAKAEAIARQEMEAARLKAQQEVEAARIRVEQEAAKARREAELARQQAEAEAKAREEVERHAKEEAEAAQARAELELARAKAEAEAKARQEIEAAKMKAQQEVEAARLEIEQKAAKARREAELARQQAEVEAKARQEAERHAREEAEAARAKAEQEVAQARAELETARAKAEAARIKAEQEAAKARKEVELARQQAEAEAKARQEAEHRAMEEAEAARAEVTQEAAQARAGLEAASVKIEAKADAMVEAGLHIKEDAEQWAEKEIFAANDLETLQESDNLLLQIARDVAQSGMQEKETVKPKPGPYPSARSSSATVLFFDVVGYTKQPVNKQIKIKNEFNQLLTDCLMAQGDADKIILDTGDGAAVGFLQHPEEALEVAMQFRKTVMANQHKDFPELKVRIGIHLGPINVVQDMNGQSNMVGDGINDAQRVMSFADADQIYISRSYYDYVSRLSDEYDDLFKYRGSQKDKHGREHSVYELVDAIAPAAEAMPSQNDEFATAMKLDAFSFAIPEAETSTSPADVHETSDTQQGYAALMGDIEQFNLPEEAQKTVVAEQIEEQTAKDQPQSAVILPSENAPEISPLIETARPVAMAHMPSAEEVTKLAKTQARIWAEAEQRAIESTKSNAERDAQPHVAKAMPVERPPHKPIPWGKLGAGLLAVLLIALFVIPLVLPTQGYATKVEQLLSEQLKQPVHIGRLAGRLLPSPRLELNDVSIGEVKQIQAQRARVNFAMSALFTSVKEIDSVELEGVQANGAAIQQISTWLQEVAADTRYPIAHIKLNQGKLETDGIQLSGIAGELNFNQAGKFSQAKLRAEGNKFALDINATPDNKMQASIAVRGSALPLLPNWIFDELDAKGELTHDELVISDMNTHIMGGVLLGDARINWRSGWRVAGNLVAKTISMQNISKVLIGDMDGKAYFQMQSAGLSKLTEAATMSGSFSIRKGVINGVDIVETARLRSRENLPGGRTHFDELSGDLSFANDVYAFRQLKINTGVLAATGTLDISKRQLSGHISADLTMRSGMGPVALQVDGTTDSPSLRTAR